MKTKNKDGNAIKRWLDQHAASIVDVAAEAGTSTTIIRTEVHGVLADRAREASAPFAGGKAIDEVLCNLRPFPVLREISATWRATLNTVLDRRRELLRRSARAMARRHPLLGDAEDFELETYVALIDRALLGRAPFSSGSHLLAVAISTLHATRMARDRLRAGTLTAGPSTSSKLAGGIAGGSEDEMLDDLLILAVQQRVRAAIGLCFEAGVLKHDGICALVDAGLIDERLAATSLGVGVEALELWRRRSDDSRRQDRHRGKSALLKTFRACGLDQILDRE